MKKIIISLGIIGVVSAIVIGGTVAYFTDTETVPDNVITAGSLDLKINGHNDPVEAVVYIEDMKPSQTWYSGPITLGVSNNPGRLYKRIVDTIECVTNGTTEPEEKAENGTEANYLPAVIWFDLEVWNGDGWDILIPDGSVTVDDLASHWIYLGVYGERMQENEIIIRQSFHMMAEAGNEYQSDSCVFTEEFMVMQTNSTCPENMYIPENLPVLASINIGNTGSETSHDLFGWSNIWDWGGNYGGGSSDGSLRLLMGPGDGCGEGYEEATFTLDAGDGYATILTLEHLDGSQNDSFDVYVNNEFVGHYTGVGGGENWIVTDFCLSDALTGVLTIKLVSTEPAVSWCNQWGQVAFSNAEIK